MSILQAFNFNIFIHLQNTIYESSNFNKNIHYCTTALMEKEVFFGGNVFKFLSFCFSICSNWCWLNCRICEQLFVAQTTVHCTESETPWHRIFIYSILGPLSKAGHAHPRNDHATTALQAKNEKIISPRCQDGVATFIYI